MALTKVSGDLLQQPIDVGIITATSITATSANFSGNVSIAGTLTYEDVTNIDSVGLITARSGIHVTGVGSSVGIGTDNPGASLQITANNPGILFQDANSGATESKIEGLSGHLYYTTDNLNRDHIFSATGESEALRITGDGNIGIGTDNPATEFHVQDGSDLLVALFESPNNHVRLRIKSSSSSLGQLEFADGNDADAGEIRYAHSTDKMTFHVGNNTERVGITSESDGTSNLEIANGNLVFSTSGTGIDFSATADGSGTTTSELFDDYEEGTWTPALQGAGTPTVTTAEGIYTKIGNFVHCTFYMAFTGATLVSSSRISGLPFAYNVTEPDIFLSRVGQCHDSSAAVGSRTCSSVGHTSSGTTWIYVDLITSGTDLSPRGEFVMRVS